MHGFVQYPRIPLQPNSLLGREHEVEHICQQFLSTDATDTRLLTITGTGGIGKTRLACAVAQRLNDAFVDGVWFVDLAPLPQIAPHASTTLVFTTIAHALNLCDAGEMSPLESLMLYLHDRQALLVLDNFEHVLPAASELAGLLAACPMLKLLVTSREPLHLRWEHLFSLSPLALPDVHETVHIPAVSELARVPAIALFVARARAVRPDFELTAHNAITIATICTRLDGLPLAIELAASRISVLSPHELLARLDNSLSLLQWAAPDLPTRHQTLRATIDWSYNLLSSAEQMLFRQLSVFVGNWSLDAAEAVVGVIHNDISTDDRRLVLSPEHDVLNGITRLLDKGLLQRHDGDEHMPRFRMLETVREYAIERFCTGGELASMRLRHANWYLGLAMQASPHWSGPEERTWLARLERESDNLRSALEWAIASGEVEMEARLCAALWMMWLRGHLREGQHRMRGVLTRTATIASSLRVRLLTGAASLALPLGNYQEAEDLYSEALRLQQALGDTFGVAYSLNLLGMVAIDQGNLERASTLLEESVARFRILQNAHGIAFSLDNLGRVRIYQERYEQAAIFLQEALDIWHTIGNMQGIAETTSDLALLTARRGESKKAITLYGEALMRLQELGNLHLIAFCIEGLAAIAVSRSRFLQAARLWGIASTLRIRSGAPLRAIERPAYEHLMAHVRIQLGIEAFTSAWMEGTQGSLKVLEEITRTTVRELLRSSKNVRAIAIPHRPDIFLSARENEVLRLIADGLSNKEIGKRLFITSNTVKYHVTSIFNKLNVNTRAQAIARATQYGLLTPATA